MPPSCPGHHALDLGGAGVTAQRMASVPASSPALPGSHPLAGSFPRAAGGAEHGLAGHGGRCHPRCLGLRLCNGGLGREALVGGPAAWSRAVRRLDHAYLLVPIDELDSSEFTRRVACLGDGLRDQPGADHA